MEFDQLEIQRLNQRIAELERENAELLQGYTAVEWSNKIKQLEQERDEFQKEIERLHDCVQHYLKQANNNIEKLQNERNQLLAQNARLITQVDKAMRIITEYADITTENRAGWWIKETDAILSETPAQSLAALFGPTLQVLEALELVINEFYLETLWSRYGTRTH